MITIYVDNKAHNVKEGTNLLEACISAGLDLPYFCWHPAMGSVGACRQCAVTVFQNEEDTRGRLVTGCMTPVAENMRLSIKSPQATEFRGQVIEALMTNHPHDCPVCEEGGECHLQDMTIMSGHTSRRYRGKKRTHKNQYLGPFINHEMNRCIACYRCVRYYKDYAGGDDLNVFAAHNHVYFGRSQDGVLENEFSGNLVEVCPTGVFTDKPFSSSYTRKWDLQTAPSTCVHCSYGCNTSPGERYGDLKRIVNRYNSEVNSYFLCDRGRFGSGFVNNDDRVKACLVRNEADKTTESISLDEAYVQLKAHRRKGKTIGIGSARATLESNFALRQFVGANNFLPGFSDNEVETISAVVEVLKHSQVPIADLVRVESADCILILGEDVTNTSPRLALAIRQATRNLSFELAAQQGIPQWQDDAVRTLGQEQYSPLFIANSYDTKLDDVATSSLVVNTCQIGNLVDLLARKVNGSTEIPASTAGDLSEQDIAWLNNAYQALRQAKRPLIVSGCSQYSPSLIQSVQALVNVIADCCENAEPAIYLTVPEVNSVGVSLIAGSLIVESGIAGSNTDNVGLKKMEKLAEGFESGEFNTLVVLENDLYRKSEQSVIDRLLNSVKNLVVLDHRLTATAAKADLFMPTATFAEANGVYVSAEGRAQYAYQVIETREEFVPAWRCLIHDKAVNAHQLLSEISREITWCSELNELLDVERQLADSSLPRQTHRHSGRTAKTADESVHEKTPVDDLESPLRYSMEGVLATANTVSEQSLPAQMVPSFWSPGWNSNQSVNKFQQETNGPLMGGNSGVRLFKPETGSSVLLNVKKREHSQPEGRFWLSPIWHIFGSEELSGLSAEIQERSPIYYARLNTQDAEAQALSEGDQVHIALNTTSDEKTNSIKTIVPLLLDSKVPRGTLLMPVGLADKAFMRFSQWVTLEKSSGADIDIEQLLPYLSRQRRNELLIATDSNTVPGQNNGGGVS